MVFDRFSDRSRKMMGLARQVSQEWNHEYIGTEHILLGLLDGEGSLALDILRDMGVDLDALRKSVTSRMTPGDEPVSTGQIPFTPRGKDVLERALLEASNLGHNWIGSEHLLAGLAQAGGIVGEALAEAKVDRDDVHQAIRKRERDGGYVGPAPSVDVLALELSRLKARVDELERRLNEE
jgi:ATP-dependent Clp protease ATP-binding subunit ClpC